VRLYAVKTLVKRAMDATVMARNFRDQEITRFDLHIRCARSSRKHRRYSSRGRAAPYH
jgi:hypothetical protein